MPIGVGLVVEDPVAMNEIKLAMDTGVEILPSDLVKLDTGVIDRLEEAEPDG